LPILYKLNKKYPSNSKIVSRLGKTLSNQVIAQNEEGWKFLKEAIILFKNENNNEKVIDHIFYYLYNLLNNEYIELLQKEIEYYENEIKNQPRYYQLLALYKESIGKPEEEIIKAFETAINIAETNEEKLFSLKALLNYLSVDPDKNSAKIEELKVMRDKYE